MSDTPRTAALIEHARTMAEVLDSHEQMERELAAVTAERDRAVKRAEYWKGEHLEGNKVIDAVTAERDALQADAMRLQWIEENASCIDLFSDPDNYVRVWYGKGGISTSTGRTLTEAADAAIAASKGKP